jgi:uncharacterized DUF497 family protein
MRHHCYDRFDPVEEDSRHDSVHASFDSDSDANTTYGSDHDGGSETSFPAPTLRIWSRPLGGSNGGEGKIVFSPCSTAASTPGLDADEFFVEELTLSHTTLEPESRVTGLVWLFEGMLRTNAPFAHIADVEKALLSYLHNHAVTLVDVEALLHDARAVMLSDLERVRSRHRYVARADYFDQANIVSNRKVMNTLAVNIASFHVQGAISGTEVEAILTHIVSVEPKLFNLVVQKIEQEQHRYKSRVLPCPHIRPRCEHLESVCFTPRQAAMNKKQKKKTETRPNTIRTADPRERGLWAFTRMHNGPGLYDWKCKTKVKLPEATKQKRLECKRKVPRPQSPAALVADMSVQTKPFLDFSEGIAIKVRLPQW